MWVDPYKEKSGDGSTPEKAFTTIREACNKIEKESIENAGIFVLPKPDGTGY